MNKFNNKMYEDSYVRNLVGKIAFSIIVFILSLMWVTVVIGV
jgi:hypothetical protein